ncbi:MAG: DUF4263 domain-containing protein [Desulfuromonadaceae bacterium]|nr:DUF4263 domain-containing protein [Desulfuromonadaceae bacterium]
MSENDIVYGQAVRHDREINREDNLHYHNDITKSMVSEFRNILDSKGDETSIHNYLANNLGLVYGALYRSGKGHHGLQIISKQALIQKSHMGKGMIPDFIVGGDSSEGWGWFIIELKAYSENLFVEKKSEISFSGNANRGLCQLLEYVDKGSEIQGFIRDTLKLENFREPQGILVIGGSKELENNERRKALRRIVNNITNKIRIINYDSLFNAVDGAANFFDK